MKVVIFKKDIFLFGAFDERSVAALLLSFGPPWKLLFYHINKLLLYFIRINFACQCDVSSQKLRKMTKNRTYKTYKQTFIYLSAYKSLSLLQSVTSTVNQVCKKLKMDEKSYKNVRHGRVIPASVHAVKNGRRKMEDRHVLIHDLNAIFSESQVSLIFITKGSSINISPRGVTKILLYWLIFQV